jgi:hypothetical protein
VTHPIPAGCGIAYPHAFFSSLTVAISAKMRQTAKNSRKTLAYQMVIIKRQFII